MKQYTVRQPIEISGIALHSGKNVKMTLKPLPVNSGIIFKRVDLKTNNIIVANWSNVNFTQMCTMVDNGKGVGVATIEHLMAALFSLLIDNVLIEIDGPEVPVLDGSSKVYIDKILSVGLQELDDYKKILKILKPLEVKNKDWSIAIKPADDFIINCSIDFPNKAIGKQFYKYSSSRTNFIDEISEARTFGFLKDVEFLHKNGLGLGASLENTVVIDGDKVLNEEGLRYENEFVRHKVLDACGDLFLSGYFILGEVTANKSGHKANNDLLRLIFSDKNNYEIINYNKNKPIIKYSLSRMSELINY